MSAYRFDLVDHNDIPCLHVMLDAGNMGLTEVYIPLDDIMESATKQGYALYTLSDAMLQKVCESQDFRNQTDILRRLDALEQQLSEQGINDLAVAIERRIVSRMRYGRNPYIERAK